MAEGLIVLTIFQPCTGKFIIHLCLDSCVLEVLFLCENAEFFMNTLIRPRGKIKYRSIDNTKIRKRKRKFLPKK